PRREDLGKISLPLRPKGYLISSIRLLADVSQEGVALCVPDRLSILHYVGEVDLAARLVKIGTLLSDKAMVPESVKYEVDRYLALVSSGQASAELRVVADRLIDWISHDSGASLFLDAP